MPYKKHCLASLKDEVRVLSMIEEPQIPPSLGSRWRYLAEMGHQGCDWSEPRRQLQVRLEVLERAFSAQEEKENENTQYNKPRGMDTEMLFAGMINLLIRIVLLPSSRGLVCVLFPDKVLCRSSEWETTTRLHTKRVFTITDLRKE